MIQIAWLWLRHQPQSALAVWYRERIKRKGGRLGKTTIVALARKLLVTWWTMLLKQHRISCSFFRVKSCDCGADERMLLG